MIKTYHVNTSNTMSWVVVLFNAIWIRLASQEISMEKNNYIIDRLILAFGIWKIEFEFVISEYGKRWWIQNS